MAIMTLLLLNCQVNFWCNCLLFC